MNALRASFAFLTVLPVGPRDGSGLASARAYFPLVGFALGGAVAGFDRLAGGTFGRELTAALTVVGLLAATRMLHVDGLIDSCDALFGGYTRERRLEILKDPRAGAFGVIGGVSVLFLKWAAVVTLAGPVRLPMLVLFPLLGRWSAVAVMETVPYGRASGLGSPLLASRRAWQPGVAAATALVASLLVAGPLGAILLAGVTALALLLGAWMARLLGGVTGDGYGAVVEVTEAAALIGAVALYELWPGLLDGRAGFPG